MKKRILFADGETAALRDIKDGLAGCARDWELVYTTNGLEALGILTQQPCDAVVADLRLTDMSGAQLLTQVMKQYPQMHRVVFADLGDLQSLLKCVGGFHQFLTLPCEAERLQAVLERVFEFDVWLPNQTVRQLVGRIPKLPSPADRYAHVVKELQSGSATTEKIGALIARDPAMTGKVLQLANSAVYGPPPDEADPVEAVKQLGLANTQALLLLSHTYSNFTVLEGFDFSVAALWQHSLTISQLAHRIALSEGAAAAAAQHAATAGLLHDIGKLALAANLPEHYHEVENRMNANGLPVWEAEQEVFGATHGDVGGCLLGTWALPIPIVEAVALHHHPTQFLSQSFSPLTAVHVANAFSHAENLGHAESLVDRDYLRELGLEQRLPAWWELCRLETQTQEA